jgi:hypothetical protein
MSIISEINAEHAHELAFHAGHEVSIRVYGDGEATLECEECGDVLINLYRKDPGRPTIRADLTYQDGDNLTRYKAWPHEVIPDDMEVE